MRELFDKKFVHFMWEDELEGKAGFFADNIDNLKCKVNIGSVNDITNVAKKDDEEMCINFPFRMKWSGSKFRFFYYDPHYEIKKAYLYNRCFEQVRKLVNEGTRLDCIVPELLRLQEGE